MSVEQLRSFDEKCVSSYWDEFVHLSPVWENAEIMKLSTHMQRKCTSLCINDQYIKLFHAF